jgi:hypothetical protein
MKLELTIGYWDLGLLDCNLIYRRIHPELDLLQHGTTLFRAAGALFFPRMKLAEKFIHCFVILRRRR